MVEVIAELINHNLEREEKERLLRAKVSELKEIFEHTSLNDLRGLKINLDAPEEDELEDLLQDEHESTLD